MSERSHHARHLLHIVGVSMMLLVASCTQDTTSSEPTPPPPAISSVTATPSVPLSPSSSPTQAQATQSPSQSINSKLTPSPTQGSADPRWVFFSKDKTRWSSAWFPGRHRIMIGYGCTPAPYYSSDSRCPGKQGFHHGIDVAIPCDTPLTAGREARVLDSGALGPAYGTNPVLLRVAGHDLVIGHTRKVLAKPGDVLRPGQRFASVSDSGAPDGCHLHFETRRPGTGVSGAVAPTELLGLK